MGLATDGFPLVGQELCSKPAYFRLCSGMIPFSGPSRFFTATCFNAAVRCCFPEKVLAQHFLMRAVERIPQHLFLSLSAEGVARTPFAKCGFKPRLVAAATVLPGHFTSSLKWVTWRVPGALLRSHFENEIQNAGLQKTDARFRFKRTRGNTVFAGRVIHSLQWVRAKLPGTFLCSCCATSDFPLVGHRRVSQHTFFRAARPADSLRWDKNEFRRTPNFEAIVNDKSTAPL